MGATLWSASSASGDSLKSLHATSRLTTTGSGKQPAPAVMEVWMKNNKMRAKFGDRVQILDGTSAMFYSTKDPQKRLMSQPLPPGYRATTIAQRLQQMQMVPPKASKKKVGTAKLLGYDTTIYEVTMPGTTPDQKQSLKMWQATIQGATVPLRVEARALQGTMINEVIAIEVNRSLPDTLFAAPAGYKKVTIPSQPPLPPGAALAKPKH